MLSYLSILQHIWRKHFIYLDYIYVSILNGVYIA